MQSADDATKADLVKAKRNLADILEVLIAAQDRLLSTCPHTKHLVAGGKAKLDSDEEIESSPDEGGSDDDGSIPDYRGDSDSDEKMQIIRPVVQKSTKKGKKKRRTVEAYSKLLAKRFSDYQPFRNATLAKWDERTRLTAGGKMAANKDFSGFDSSLIKQIDTILADKHRLIKRTQTKRSDIERIGSDSTATVDAEVFDDDDFYQQLLRELIERKSADITDPVAMSRQFLEVQKLRQKRAKKKVDTKASKGRKVRFEVMAKLVNFQAPNTHSTWTDDAKSELFQSLFK